MSRLRIEASCCACLLSVVALLLLPTQSRAAIDRVALQVVDESGAPVAKCEALTVSERDRTPPGWSAGRDGLVHVGPLSADTPVDIVVRAEGFASSMQRFKDEELAKLIAGEGKVTLVRGEPAQVKFKLPEGLVWRGDVAPQIYVHAHKHLIPHTRQGMGATQKATTELNELGAVSEKPESASVRLAADSPAFSVGIHAPGFLRFFDAGPFSPADVKDGVLEVELPKPAELTIKFDLGDSDAEKLPHAGVNYSIGILGTATRNLFLVDQGTRQGLRLDLRLADLTAGQYFVSVNTTPKEGERSSPMFRESRQVELTAGQHEDVTIPFVPLDPNSYKGERTARLKLTKPDGSPVNGRALSITYSDKNYGGVPVFQGEVPQSGEVELAGIKDASAGGPVMYMVMLGGEHLGQFSFKAKSGDEEFAFKLPPIAGDIGPDLELTNIFSGEKTKLSDFRGKVVCIDFWATWCGPCQVPMEHLDHLAVEKLEAWKDQVALVPISIDDKMETIKPHLDSKGWANLTHYWTGSDNGQGWKSPAPQAYVVSGVPTSLILGRDGKILWRGHPADTTGGTLEERIDAAIRGE